MSARRGSAPALAAGMTAAIIAALVLAGQVVAAEAADAAFVRVDEVGYVAAAHKRAFLLAGGSAATATFSVRDASARRSTRPRSVRARAPGARASPTSTGWTSTR
jgi:hypothetical protein